MPTNSLWNIIQASEVLFHTDFADFTDLWRLIVIAITQITAAKAAIGCAKPICEIAAQAAEINRNSCDLCNLWAISTYEFSNFLTAETSK